MAFQAGLSSSLFCASMERTELFRYLIMGRDRSCPCEGPPPDRRQASRFAGGVLPDLYVRLRVGYRAHGGFVMEVSQWNGLKG